MPLRDQLEAVLGQTYAIERELAGGGMSRVFVAEERSLQRMVAIKVLPPELSGEINLERFKREIKLAATLQHPHIVPVFAAGDVGGIPFFTMPFVEGESLRALLKRGELPIPEVVSILRDVTKALVYAHAHGVVHRDIKPDNVLLSSHAATVTDFGVAKALSASTSPGAPLTEAGMALGTPAYMAPEQASADPNIDARADIYALGVLAYEMLTGHTPFGGRTPQQVLAAQVTEMPVPVNQERASVPDGLAELVTRCLAKRPADRPQTAEEVLHALESLGTPTGGLPPTRATPGPRRGRRAIAVGAAAVVVLAVGGWLAVRAHAKSPTIVDNAAGDPRPAAPKWRPTSIVVAPFTNMTNDTSLNVLGAIAAQTMTDGLSQLDSIAVMSPGEGLLDSTGAVRRVSGADAARALGREAKAASVVWGSYYRDGDSLRVQGQVIDVKDGRVQITLDAMRAPATSPVAAMEAVRDRLVSAIDATGLKSRLGSIGRPPNMPAYKEFLLGLKDKWDNPRPNADSMLRHFENASRLDTTFTMALYYVILVHSNASNTNGPRRIPSFKSEDSALRILSARRSRMNATELELLDDATAMAHADWEGALTATRKLQARDSGLRFIQNIAFNALATNRPQEAANVFKTWPDSAVPAGWIGLMEMQAYAYHALGDYKENLKVVQKWRKVAPTSSALFNRERDADAALGDVASIRGLIDSVMALFTGTGNPANNYYLAAAELRAHGHAAEADKFVAEGLAWMATRPVSETSRPAWQATLAKLLMLSGNLDSAAAIVARYVPGDTGYYAGPRVAMAQIAGLRHDTTTALSTLAVLDSLAKNPYDHGRMRVFEAQIAACMGRKAEAVRYLTAALQEGYRFDYDNWHADPAFDSLRDYAPFKALMRPKG